MEQILSNLNEYCVVDDDQVVEEETKKDTIVFGNEIESFLQSQRTLENNEHENGHVASDLILSDLEEDLNDTLRLFNQKIFNKNRSEELDERRVVPVDDDSEGAVECNICCFSYKLEDMFSLQACLEHKNCKNCMADYLKSKVEDGKVLKIGCMHYKCPKQFTQEDVQ